MMQSDSQQVQPPKKKHTLRTIALAVVGVFVVITVISALSGGDDDDPGRQTPAAGQTTGTEPARTAPGQQTTSRPPSKVAPKPVPTAAPKPAVDCAGQEDRTKPCEIHVGKAFVLGKHQVQAGWKVAPSDGLDLPELTAKARNTSDKASAMFVTIKFLRGDEVVMNISCTTDQLEPGQVQAANCFGGEKFTKKYDRITAEATF